jgi:subtilase family serine protease
MKFPLTQIATSVALFLLSAASISAQERKTLHTGVPEVVAQLQRLELLPATNRLRLAIGLPWRNQGTLTNLLHQLYHLGSPNFHHFLTPSQFTEQFGPTEQDYQSVMDYAKSNGLQVAGTYANRAVLDVSGSVADIENVFQVHLGTYHHPTENRDFYAPDVEPSVDASLPISYVVGLDNYEIPKPLVRKSISPVAGTGNGAGTGNYLGTGSGTNGWYEGFDFRNAYVPGVPLTGSGQVVGLFELDGYNSGDITKYESLAGLSSVPLDTVVLPGATGTAGGNNDEVCIDIEMVVSMAQGLNAVDVVEGYTGVDAMNELADPTYGEPFANQISSSWDFSGETVNEAQLIEMAAQGQSFFLASGDSGAPSGGVQTSGADYNYLTTVGGTELYMNGTGSSWQAETVWDYQYIQGASTGFIATDLGIPAYQLSVNPAANGGSKTYRNVPDVAMVADFCVGVYTETGPPVVTGFVNHLGGTSLAAPLWAAFTSLVNEQAASQGKPTVGFLNPALYDIAQGGFYNSCFHDVTQGNNTNSDTDNLYFAGPGYDNCTGLGSPNGFNLINALVAYSGPIFVDFNYTGSTQNGSYQYPYKTLAQGVSAVSPGGTIFIETAGSSSETMTITKPMTITASDGAATVGN